MHIQVSVETEFVELQELYFIFVVVLSVFTVNYRLKFYT